MREDRFRDLPVGQTFDFINPKEAGYNSFFHRCRKVSARKYVSLEDGTEMQVGTVDCAVYNVGED